MVDAESEKLLAAAQQGDRAALDNLLRAHRHRVFRYGLRVCRTSEDAEDAVQQTLWSAARSIRTFRGAAAVSTWLFTIVRNYCLRLIGREHFYVDLDEVTATVTDLRPNVEDEAASREIHDILAAALAQLDPIHREVILLRDVQGVTAPEAASLLGVTLPAVKSRLHRARAELRRLVHARV
jgi:RNA polymerase sigma-70 factor, ECF subfamily